MNEKTTVATTAVDLLKTRFKAYLNKDQDAILKTWKPSTRPSSINFDNVWTKLEIIDSYEHKELHNAA